MKNLMNVITTSLLIILCKGVFAQETLEVTVGEIKSAEGNVIVMLFESEEGFPIDLTKAVHTGIAKANKGKVTILVEGLKVGAYGISVFHDANNNKEIDTNFIGFPKESVGAFNHRAFGKPSFDKCIYEVKPAQTNKIEIKLIN